MRKSVLRLLGYALWTSGVLNYAWEILVSRDPVQLQLSIIRNLTLGVFALVLFVAVLGEEEPEGVKRKEERS